MAAAPAARKLCDAAGGWVFGKAIPSLARAKSAAGSLLVKAGDAAGPPIAKAVSAAGSLLAGAASLVRRVDRRVWIGAGGCGAAAVVCVMLVTALSAPNVWSVTLDGENIGYVIDEAEFESVLEGAERRIAEENSGVKVLIDDSGVACGESEKKINKVELLTAEALADRLEGAGLCKAEAWTIGVNGEAILTLASKADAEAVLSRVKSSYIGSGSELLEAAFAEDVALSPIPVDFGEPTTDVDTAVTYILTGTKEPKVYTVQAGDTSWDIAIANRLSQDELVQANPGLMPERLKIGQQLNLYEIKPYVTIRTVELATWIQPIAFDTVYESSAELYKGQTKVISPGVAGSREIKTRITKQNGVEIEAVEVASALTAEPQTQIAAVGTKSIATFTGTGSLSSPVGRVEISSAYGVSRGGRRHQGVDFRNPKGTPIYAADDGVVTVSKYYNNGYGNLVVLSHGNGLETYYAHCDALLVSVGEVVSKGQAIATVGITGNASGYHLHFEVKKNGVNQNPMNYL
jgi:murein DD-endopeptidase MepM/ murein hydrolase activator NlpD